MTVSYITYETKDVKKRVLGASAALEKVASAYLDYDSDPDCSGLVINSTHKFIDHKTCKYGKHGS